MEISPQIELFSPLLKTSFHAGPNLNGNAIHAPIPAENTFKIPPTERINLTDKQILDNHLKSFLAEKYPDFFPIDSIPSLEFRQKFYADNKNNFSDYCNLMPAFPSGKHEARLKLLVNDLRLAYNTVNEKGIFVDYLSFLTKMVKTYPEPSIYAKGSIHYSDLQSPDLAELLLDIYSDIHSRKALDSDSVLSHRRQTQLESMLITNINNILYDDQMNKRLDELLKTHHREASDLGVMFCFRQGYGDLPIELDPSRKSNSAHDLLAKPVINFYRSSVDPDHLEQQALNKFNKAHPGNHLEMSTDDKTTLSSLEVNGLPLDLNKNLLVDMINLVTQLNSSTNLKFNTGISLKIPFTDDILLMIDLNKELQSKVKAKTIQHDEIIRLDRNPTIFENLQKYLDKDRMLIFKDLPLPVNLNNRKITDRAAPIQVNTFFNQSLLIKALAHLRFDNKGILANQLNFDRLEHVIADKDFVDKLTNVIVEPFSAQAQKFMQEIYNSIIQTEKNLKLKPVIDQLANENCLPAFNPKFISKMIKNFIDEKEERNLLVKLNNRLQGKTFLKEVFEMTDDRLFELIKLAIKPDSPESRSLIETILNLSEPIQLKSLFKFANLLDSKILTDSSLKDLFINKIEKTNFRDFAEEALKTSANIPPEIFEKILKTKVEKLPDSAIELLEILKSNYIINRDNLKLFNSIAWSRPKFRDLDKQLFSQNIVGSRTFSDELGPLVFHNLQPFISEIGIGDFLQIMEQAQEQGFSTKPFRIKLNLQRIDYPEAPEANDYLFQACAENESPLPIQPQVGDRVSLEKDMLLQDIYNIKLKSFSLPIDSESRKRLLERIKDLDPVSKVKVFSAMKTPNKQILTELINSNIFPVELHDHLLEGFSTEPVNCSTVFNQAFSSEARESLLLRIIEVNKENLSPVVNNLNKFLLNNSDSNNVNFIKDCIIKAGNNERSTRSAGKFLEYLPDLKFSSREISDIFTNLKHISSKSLNTILEKPEFPFDSKLYLLEKAISKSHLNVIFETKKGRLLTNVSSVAIPKNQNLSSTFEALAKMPHEIHGEVLSHLKLNSAAQLQQICDTELLSNQNRARFIKSIGAFDKDFLPYLANEKLSDDSKQHILKIAYLQNKPALAEFFSINNDLRIKKQLTSFMQRNASLIEYLPSFGFSLDEMKKVVEGIRQIDPRNYKNIFLTKDDNKLLKSNPLPDEILKLLTKRALEDTENGEAFIKFVISNKDKLNKVVQETF